MYNLSPNRVPPGGGESSIQTCTLQYFAYLVILRLFKITLHFQNVKSLQIQNSFDNFFRINLPSTNSISLLQHAKTFFLHTCVRKTYTQMYTTHVRKRIHKCTAARTQMCTHRPCKLALGSPHTNALMSYLYYTQYNCLYHIHT